MLFADCYIWMWNTSVCLRKWFTIPLQDELCIYLATWLLYNHLCFCMPLSSCLPISMPAFSFTCLYICQSADCLYLPVFIICLSFCLYLSVCRVPFFIHIQCWLLMCSLFTSRVSVFRDAGVAAQCDRMLNHHFRRNPDLQEELQIQAAVAAGDVYTVRKMLEQGYSPKIRDANGWTLLHFSAAKGKERCVRVFLEHGGRRSGQFLFDSVETVVLLNISAELLKVYWFSPVRLRITMMYWEFYRCRNLFQKLDGAMKLG